MLAQYREFVEAVDRLSARIAHRYHTLIVCSEGCSSCCAHPLSVFEVEAAAIRHAIRGLADDVRETLLIQAQMVDSDQPAVCPLLVNHRCSIYASRPIICRTQGLPLLIEAENGASEVNFCPLNFRTPGATDDLDEDYLVPLEAINAGLVRANLNYCAKLGRPKSEARFSTAEIILRSCRTV